MLNKVISILVPAYNAEKYLPQCLDSILLQTYRDLQIVVIDDGSIDSTWDLMQYYAKLDERIEIYHQENQGVAVTRNHLLSKIKGDCFLFIDSDDWIEPDMVEFMYDKLVSNDVQISICGSFINEGHQAFSYVGEIWTREQAVKEFLCHTRLRGSLWNKLISTSLLRNESVFNPQFSYGEDALFCWGIINNCKSIYICDKQLYHYRMNDSSISHLRFGPQKYSAHFVWESIVSSTQRTWSIFTGIAEARWGMEDSLLLRGAAHDGYPKDDSIINLQLSIKANYYQMRRCGFISWKWLLYAFFASKSYCLAKLF